VSLTDELAAAQSRQGGICGVARALADTDDPDLAREAADTIAARLTDVAGRPRWKYEAAALSRVLAQHGIRVSAYSISRHRRGACTCR